MKNTLVIYDFETVHNGNINPYTDQPIQLAAIAINSKTLEIKAGSEFNSWARPESFAEINDESISWHCKQRKWTKEQFMEKLTTAPPLSTVVNNFVQYLGQFNYKKSKFTAPVKGGSNIRKYDDIIWDRLRQQFKIGDDEGFHPRDSIDLLDVCFLWFENLSEPSKYSLDYLRPYFGLTIEDSHDALKDCKDVGEILVRFLKLHRRVALNTKFKDSMKT